MDVVPSMDAYSAFFGEAWHGKGTIGEINSVRRGLFAARQVEARQEMGKSSPHRAEEL
jgi:hypothetical protein